MFLKLVYVRSCVLPTTSNDRGTLCLFLLNHIKLHFCRKRGSTRHFQWWVATPCPCLQVIVCHWYVLVIQLTERLNLNKFILTPSATSDYREITTRVIIIYIYILTWIQRATYWCISLLKKGETDRLLRKDATW